MLVAGQAAAGQPAAIQLIELGPGKGTMMVDMLRAIQQLPIDCAISVHMVEASRTLRDAQYAALCTPPNPKGAVTDKIGLAPKDESPVQTVYGVPVTWHADLSAVPVDPAAYPMVVAHEFFDALPVHQFEARGGEWRERLVGLTAAAAVKTPQTSHLDDAAEFGFALAPGQTASFRLAKALDCLGDSSIDGAVAEVCLDAVHVCQEVRRRLLAGGNGGTALMVDYGDATVSKDTFRAFRRHEEVGVFDGPGTADLTADVNFGHLKRFFAASSEGGAGSDLGVESLTEDSVDFLGPITQREFLLGMAIQHRAEVLCQRVRPAESNAIKLQVHKLVNDMGTRFKFAAVVAAADGKKAAPVPVFQ